MTKRYCAGSPSIDASHALTAGSACERSIARPNVVIVGAEGDEPLGIPGAAALGGVELGFDRQRLLVDDGHRRRRAIQIALHDLMRALGEQQVADAVGQIGGGRQSRRHLAPSRD